MDRTKKICDAGTREVVSRASSVSTVAPINASGAMKVIRRLTTPQLPEIPGTKRPDKHVIPSKAATSAYYLSSQPNPVFVPNLTNIIIFETDIGYTCLFTPNFLSAKIHAAVLRKQMEKQVIAKHSGGPFRAPPM